MRPSLKERLGIRLWMMWNVRMLAFVRPTIVDISDDRVVARIRLTHRSRNHLHSMYFGALCAGADYAGGLIAMRHIQKNGNKASLIFKDVHGEFLKRVEGDALLTCDDGAAIRAAVERTLQSGERENLPVNVAVTVPEKFGEEPVAKFTLTLSLKRKS